MNYKERVLEILKEESGTKIQRISRKLGLKTKIIEKALEELMAEGLVEEKVVAGELMYFKKKKSLLPFDFDLNNLKFSFKIKYFYYVFILIAVLFANQPWLLPGHPMGGGDYDFHFYKSWLARDNLLHLFERPYNWDPYTNSLFDRYYVPLGHFFIGLSAFVFDLRNAVAFIVFLCSFLGGLGTFFAAKNYMKDKYAFISALAYVFSAVFFYEIVQEGGFPRLFVYGLFPWVIYFVEKSFISNKYKNTIIASLLSAAALLSHFEPGIRVPIFASLLLAFNHLSAFFKNKKIIFSKKQIIDFLKHVSIYLLLILGFSSFHMLPAMIEYLSLKTYLDVSHVDFLQPITSLTQFLKLVFERFPLILIPFTKKYLGIPILILSVFGLIKKDKKAIFYAFSFSLFLLTFIAPSIHLINLLFTQMTERILFMCVFSLAILLGFAAKNLSLIVSKYKPFFKHSVIFIIIFIILITFYPQVYTINNRIHPMGVFPESVYSDLDVSDGSRVLGSYLICWICLLNEGSCSCYTWDALTDPFYENWIPKLGLLYLADFEGPASESYSLMDVNYVVTYANGPFMQKLYQDDGFTYEIIRSQDSGSITVFNLTKHFKAMVPDHTVYLENYSDFQEISSKDYFIAERILYVHPTLGMPDPDGLELYISDSELSSKISALRIWYAESRTQSSSVTANFTWNNKRVYTNLSEDKFILIAMMYYPTWHAFDDRGVELPVYMCDGGLLCVQTPASTTYFDLVWVEPCYAYLGVIISLSSLVLIIIILKRKN